MHTPKTSEELIDSLGDVSQETNYNLSQEANSGTNYTNTQIDEIFNSIFSVVDSEPQINEDRSTNLPVPNTEPSVVTENIPIESSVAPKKSIALVFSISDSQCCIKGLSCSLLSNSLSEREDGGRSGISKQKKRKK